MKAASITELKRELKHQTEEELITLCLTMAKFKKDNKELLTYLLFEASDEDTFIENVKEEVEEQFSQINRASFYYIKKGIRKVLRNLKKNIRYSKKKETEVQLLIHFCTQLKDMRPSIRRSITMTNLYDRQVKAIEKAIGYLHEDLQYDYQSELEELF